MLVCIFLGMFGLLLIIDMCIVFVRLGEVVSLI